MDVSGGFWGAVGARAPPPPPIYMIRNNRHHNHFFENFSWNNGWAPLLWGAPPSYQSFFSGSTIRCGHTTMCCLFQGIQFLSLQYDILRSGRLHAEHPHVYCSLLHYSLQHISLLAPITFCLKICITPETDVHSETSHGECIVFQNFGNIWQGR